MEPILINVPVDVNEANPNLRLHWRKLAAVKKRHKIAAGWAWIAAGRPVAKTYPVTVNVTIRRGNALDGDNVWASLKGVIDGAFKKAITPDDSLKYLIPGTVTQVIGKEWKTRPEVEFSITQAQ
jgi:hypothetical protein